MNRPRHTCTQHEIRSQAIKLLCEARSNALLFMQYAGHHIEPLRYEWRNEWDAGEYAFNTCTRAISALVRG